jgi:glutamine synthetase
MALPKEIFAEIKKAHITLVRFQWLGTDLVLKAMVTHVNYLEDAIKTGIGITKAVQSSTPWDSLAPRGFGPESGEYKIIPDLETFSVLPYTSNTSRFICELCDHDLKPATTDPRNFLRRMIQLTHQMGYHPMAAFESEFNLYKKIDGKKVPFERETTASPHSFDMANPILQDWVTSLSKMGVKVERIKKEGGEGQFELIVHYSDALKAADDMVTIRDVVKGVAIRRGYSTTFLPKVFRFPNGMHVHISLWDVKKKKNMFSDPSDDIGLSETAYHFIGGLMKHMKALCALSAPLPISYKRLLPGSWAPSHNYYGFDNRAAAIRIPSQSLPRREEAVRLEYRLPDPTANPYLVLGSALAAGLDGIKNQIDPGPPLNIDVAKLREEEADNLGLIRLPQTLIEAVNELKKSSFLREVVGEDLIDKYVGVREAEWKFYMDQVTDAEIDPYIEHF